MRLQNRIALITGAGKGIGLAIAKMFAKEGATCILTDIDESLGTLAASELGTPHCFQYLDVSIESDWKRVIEYTLKSFGRLDILVNNAGITGLEKGFGPQDPEHLSLEEWRKIHAINSDGVFLGCKHAISAMKQRRSGSIINISSRSGLVGIPEASAYAASKAAVRNHTKSVALYAQKQGYKIRANSLHPATILTPLWDSMLGTGKEREKNLQELTSHIPMKKMGTPEDVAFAAVYLASDEAKYVTGIELTIDGGILAAAGASPKKMKE
ncbi:MAG: glucose 1-dehydrogenase [Chlamydiota bacterium]